MAIDRAWEDFSLMEAAGLDQDSAVSVLLGHDMSAQLRPDNARDLAGRLKTADLELLANNMRSDELHPWHVERLIFQLVAGLHKAISK